MRASAAAKTPSKRLYILAAVLFFWVFAVLVRLVDLQVVQYSFFYNLASRQTTRRVDVEPRRGTVYDRNGTELAMSIDVDSVFAVPGEIPDQESTAHILADVLHIDAQELLSHMRAQKNFIWVKRKIAARTTARLSRAPRGTPTARAGSIAALSPAISISTIGCPSSFAGISARLVTGTVSAQTKSAQPRSARGAFHT